MNTSKRTTTTATKTNTRTLKDANPEEHTETRVQKDISPAGKNNKTEKDETLEQNQKWKV